MILSARQGADAPSVAVVGAGVCGLAAAIRLAEAGLPVTVHDPSTYAGGLTGGFQVGGGSVERFYHHLFQSDTIAAAWIAQLGLADRLEFLPSTMGFYSRGHLYRFGTPLSLLRFAPLPLVDRVRLGLRIRGLSRTAGPGDFEDVTAMDWLAERASARELEVFWNPLMAAKFSSDRDRVSMAWLWARFRARAGSSVGAGERLGYLRGGFQQLGDALTERARRVGVDVRLGSSVTGVVVEGGAVRGLTTAGQGFEPCSGVVWTPSLAALARVVPELDPAYRERCLSIRYHQAIVMVVELAAPALPYYWVTVGDSTLPFTVAVEHTRLVGTRDYSGRTLVYLGRYAPPDDPIVDEDDESVSRRFLGAATEAFSPGFASPLAAHVFRAPAAQPIVPPGWATERPRMRTGIRGLLAANMAQIYPWDRGINYSLALGEEVAAAMALEISPQAVVAES